MDELVIAKKSDLVEIADAIRNKTGTSETLSLDEMVVSINELTSEPALTTLVVNPGKDEQHIIPHETFDGFSDVVVAGDADLIAENIKSGVTIFNVAGSFEGGPDLTVIGGTTQPTGTENMVWVNTDTTINGYAFSATEPENPVEGMVWFGTGTSSNTAINVDKNNTVMLYPLDCKQYVSGAWISKTANVYLNRTWIELWAGMIFDNGDEYTVITGGFSGVGSFQQITTNKDGYLGVLAGYGETGAILTNNAIDLTRFSKLTAVVKGTGGNTKAFGITETRGTSFSALQYISSTSDTTVSIDVSSCDGPYYIGVRAYANNWAYAKQIKLEV